MNGKRLPMAGMGAAVLQMALVGTVVCLSWAAAILDAGEAFHFDARSLSFQPSAEMETFTATFRFTCVSRTLVSILGVNPSCSCMSTRLNCTVYTPKQVGEISVDYTIGNASGVVERTITLLTNSADEPRIVLTIQANLPLAPSFTPSLTIWALDSQPVTKTVAVLLPLGFSHHLLGVECPDGRWHASLAPGADARSSIISITPTTTAELMTAKITILTESHKTYSIIAGVLHDFHPAPAGTPPAH